MTTSALPDVTKQLEDVPCDLCGVRNEEFLYTKPGTLTGHPFRVVRCRLCGLIYLNPRLNEQGLTELYNQNYYEGKGFDAHVDYLQASGGSGEAGFFQPDIILRTIAKWAAPPAALLDYGCGVGHLLRAAAAQGYRADGFEKSSFAAQRGAPPEIRLYQREEDIPASHYNVVTAVEVLEHCASPLRALETIYNALKPGGLFFYTTENFDGFYAQWKTGVKDTSLDGYIVPEGHIYFYSPSVMESYFRKVGFRDVLAYEPQGYLKKSALARLLSSVRLIDTAKGAPETLLEKALYYGGRRALYLLGKKRFLPLARK
jgi:SAM-dependent methyltransferase